MAKEAKHIIVKPIYDEFSNMPYYISHEGKPILFLSEPLSREEKLFYLKHIVHCVNTHATLTTQRDDLLEKLRRIKVVADMQNSIDSAAELKADGQIISRMAESAIAQCKEKTDERTKTKTAM